MKQYEMCELSFSGPLLEDSPGIVPLTGHISRGKEVHEVKGFYAGDGCYKVRFLPKSAGTYAYRISGCIQAEGYIEAEKKEGHGILQAKGSAFVFEDGTPFFPFGTTVYALTHQEDALVEETLATLAASPFNKIRLCLFPKDYEYNHNEPPFYPFEKKGDGSWNVAKPCPAFWEDFEKKICRLAYLGFQVDLILFHPYDRWGFSRFAKEENFLYLDYLLRRLSAYPFLWWSLANEFDFCYPGKTQTDFEEIEEFIADRDSYRHLLSCHNCFGSWDYARENTSHVSCQAKTVYQVGQLVRRYGKPVVIDECCYEGNLSQLWGCLSGEEMTARFWETMVGGGYCTHGETLLTDKDSNTHLFEKDFSQPFAENLSLTNETQEPILWWSRGGTLKGSSPSRIAFLKEFVDSLPGPIVPVKSWYEEMWDLIEETKADPHNETFLQLPAFTQGMLSSLARLSEAERDRLFAGEHVTHGMVGDNRVHIWYLYHFTPAFYSPELPAEFSYDIEILDTWNQTRETVLRQVSGPVTVPLPGKPYMAIVATSTSAAKGAAGIPFAPNKATTP